MQIIQGDLSKVSADAIVISANPEPVCGEGVDAAIYDAAGAESLLDIRKTVGRISVGQAAYTQAFSLQAKYIIHTVAPMWRDGSHGELGLLVNCYYNCLKLAEQLGCKSIAFPLIGTESGRIPRKEALQTALVVLEQYPPQKLDIKLVLYDEKTVETATTLYPNIDIRNIEDEIRRGGQPVIKDNTSVASEPTGSSLYYKKKNDVLKYLQSGGLEKNACKKADNGKTSKKKKAMIVFLSVIGIAFSFLEDEYEMEKRQAARQSKYSASQNNYSVSKNNYSVPHIEDILKVINSKYPDVYDADDFERYRKLALLGHADAMFQVGLMYHTGQGVKKDASKAVEWYQLAADKWEVHAMITLALMYYYGDVVEQDRGKARELLTKADYHGDKDEKEYAEILLELVDA